ncbi:MAG: type II toxin-antitoxin system YafQ family toxin [Lachnospiraceae bacterium]|nr:type II toxin-antitoxin system YafQ family toxin [Lachnospiraceae bacterium]
MKYKIVPSNVFKRDLKAAKKQGLNLKLLEEVIDKLAAGKKLEPKYKDHPLKGFKDSRRECHITPDWLLVYVRNKNTLILYLMATSSHSKLFWDRCPEGAARPPALF